MIGIDVADITPVELLRAILQAPVDLLYNGGIGTYVKATHESHAQVGDKSSDAFRVNGCELRCKVLAEGGNLGCTQNGRIEFSQHGGRIYTDAIDNSAGVDCFFAVFGFANHSPIGIFNVLQPHVHFAIRLKRVVV